MARWAAATASARAVSALAVSTLAASARAVSAAGDAGPAGWSRFGGLRSTTISANTAASSPTAPITREIVLLMAHPNPARRPRHQGVVPGITLERGVMPAIGRPQRGGRLRN